MKRRVQQWGKPQGFVEVETEATVGAIVGVNLFWADGTIVTKADFGSPEAPDDGIARTVWSLVLEVPPNVQALAKAVGTGFFVTTGVGEGAHRSIEPVIGRTTISNGDGLAGNVVVDLAVVPDAGGGALRRFSRDGFGRVTGTSAASTDDLAEGGNRYFTDSRGQQAVAAALTDSSDIVWDVDLGAPSIAAGAGPRIYTRGRSGAWDLSDLAVPPTTWFDADEGLGLVTVATNSQLAAAVASLFNGGTYSGAPVGVGVRNRDPNFNWRRTLYFPGGGTSRMALAGGSGFARDQPAITLIYYGAFAAESGAVVGGGTVFMHVGTNVVDVVRCGLTVSSTTAKTLRYGGRRLDGDTFDGNDVGGNMGMQPFIAFVEYNFAAGTRKIRFKCANQDADVTFQAPGNSANTDSEFIGIGASSAGNSNGGNIVLRAAGFHRGIYSINEYEHIEGYLAHRDGLAGALLTSSHPYLEVPP